MQIAAPLSAPVANEAKSIAVSIPRCSRESIEDFIPLERAASNASVYARFLACVRLSSARIKPAGSLGNSAGAEEGAGGRGEGD